MNTIEPNLSIVIIILQGREKLARCLRALAEQTSDQQPEIYVPFDDIHQDVRVLTESFPSVHFLPAGGKRTYAELRALAIRETRGQVVAVTEDHCIPAPDWVSQILEAHADEHAAIGGAVEKEAPDSALNWSLYLADYVRYANPIPAGPTHNLTDCNVTYKRSALDAVADSCQKEFHEPEVHAALESAGHSLWFCPQIVVYQQRSVKLAEAVKDRFIFGRLLGGRRAMTMSMAHRLIYTAISIILPFLLIGRIAAEVLRSRRYLGPFVRTLPYVLLLSTTWALGEFVGYLTGNTGAALSAAPDS